MLMCSVNGDCGVGEVKYGVFSGILILMLPLGFAVGMISS
jgi:hypothetical protein